jgi:hypothetical protein
MALYLKYTSLTKPDIVSVTFRMHKEIKHMTIEFLIKGACSMQVEQSLFKRRNSSQKSRKGKRALPSGERRSELGMQFLSLQKVIVRFSTNENGAKPGRTCVKLHILT